MAKVLYFKVLFLLLFSYSLTLFASDKQNNPYKINNEQNLNKTLNEQIEDYEREIEAIESTEGVYSNRLAQEVANLADIYQQQGKHDLAITTFNRSLHLNRINDGLYSKAQIPILDKIITSLKQQKDWKKVHERYNYLYWLHDRNFTEQDEDMLQILVKVANWNLTSYAMSYSPNPAQDLYSAHYLYKKALQISKDVYGQYDKRNVHLLNNKMIISYFFATFDTSKINSNLIANTEYTTATNYQNQVISLKRTSFANGRDTLLEEINILENQDEVNYFNVSEVKLKLADWYLLFEKRQSAMRLYNEAYQYATLNDTEQAFTDDLFQKPIALPHLTNLTNNTREHVPKDLLLANKKYIQASFDVTKHGRAKNIKVVNSNMKESTRLRSIALKSLRHTKFRPKLVKGVPIKTEQMTLHIFPK